MSLVQCGFDGKCTLNGTVQHQDDLCNSHCECALGGFPEALIPVDADQPHQKAVPPAERSVLEEVSQSNITYVAGTDVNATTNLTTRAELEDSSGLTNTTLLNSTFPDSASFNATLLNSTFLDLASLNVTLLNTTSLNVTDSQPGVLLTRETNLHLNASGVSHSCYADAMTVELCMGHTSCPNGVNGTLVTVAGYEECMSICTCDSTPN